MNNLIQGAGYPDADLMVIGDYARKNDESTGECLSGYYFRKIADYLHDANYSGDKTYRTCVIKQYEKGLGVGTWGQDRKLLDLHFQENGVTAEHYTNIILEEINLIKPNVILALGEYTLRILTGRSGIANFRGSVLPLSDNLLSKLEQAQPPKVVASLHPAIEHKDSSSSYLLRMDFQKAVDMVFDPRPIDNHEIIICRSYRDLLSYRGRFPDNPVEMTTDIETRFGFITCTSVSYDGRSAAVLPLTGSKVELVERCRMEWLIAKDLESSRINKINQNIGYDKRIYQRFGYRVNPVTWDTMLAAHTIAPEFPKRLGFLTSIYTDMSFYKDEGREFDPSKHSFDQLYNYCGKDAISTFQIKQKQVKDLTDLESLDFFNNFVMPLFYVYYNLDSMGILLDTGKVEELKRKYEDMYNLKELELYAITQPARLNLNSPSQIGKFMEAMGFPVLRHRVDTGFMAVNTDAESLKKMKVAAPVDYKRAKLSYEQCTRFLDLILLLRRIDKVLEYIGVRAHPWGRVHTSSKLSGTTSGRTAAGQCADQTAIWEKDKKGVDHIIWKNVGTSFQTVTKHGFIIEGEEDDDIEDGIIGKDVREIYTPDPNYLFVEIDRAQAEARVVDLIAEDYEGLLEYGTIDKHSKTAAQIFTQYTYDDIYRMAKIEKTDEGEFMRQIGKKGRHATNYDMGPFRLSNLANITMPFAKDVLRKLGQANPQIKEVFHKSVEEQVRRTLRMWNPYSRVRMFYKELNTHGIKVAYSWFPQSTISDGTKLAMRRIVDAMDKTRAFMVAENHDSITALVHYSYLRSYVVLAKQMLEEPIDFRIGCFPRDYQLIIPTDVSIGRHNWGQMHGVKRMKVSLTA